MAKRDIHHIPFSFERFFERLLWTYLSYGIFVAAVTLLAHLVGPG